MSKSAALQQAAVLKPIIGDENTSFKHYGKSFQEKIFQGLAIDKNWAQQMHEVMKPDFFDLKYLQYLCEKYFSYFDKYRCFPTMQILLDMVREDLTIFAL